MKVLGIVCSPRRGGNTEILMKLALQGAAEAGAEVELVTVAGKNIAPCDACESCAKTGKCKIRDDMQEIYPKLRAADGIIFGSPVYYWNLAAQAKIVIDRTYIFRWNRQLRNKVAGTIVVAGQRGASNTAAAYNNFFAIHRMISGAAAIAYKPEDPITPDDRGWAVLAYGREKGAVRDDPKAGAEAKALGRNIARTIERLKAASLI